MIRKRAKPRNLIHRPDKLAGVNSTDQLSGILKTPRSTNRAYNGANP
jgi:hypothetical protein